MNADQSMLTPLPACSIAGCQSPCQHSPLRLVRRGDTLSYMSPDEGKTITVRLDGNTLTKLANLGDHFMENDPLERDVSTSELVRRAINMLYATTFAEVIDEGDDE